MSIDLLFITYNRLEYTKLSLASILSDRSEQFSLTIWDNGSTDGTVEYLRNEVRDPRIKEVVYSERNVGQTAAVNTVWNASQADLIGKLDNDCLMTPGWTKILSRAHRDIESFGVIACWHFTAEDFNFERAKHKVQTFGEHQIFRHPWTCGTGLLLKRSIFQKLGPMQDRATTEYWLKVAEAGFVNGFYYPLVLQEHMDDPKSAYCTTNSAEGFAAARSTTVGLAADRYSDPEGRLAWREKIINNLLDEPYDPAYFRAKRARNSTFVGKIRTGLRKVLNRS